MPVPRPVLATLAALLIANGGRGASPAVAGVYTCVSAAPVLHFDRDGTTKQIGTSQRTDALELNADGTLRTAMTTGRGYSTHGRGVWALKGDRLYFALEALLPPNQTSDTRSLGAVRVAATADGIAFSDIAGHGLGTPHMTRTGTAELGPPVAPAAVAELKAALDRVMQPVPRPPYAGVATEEALREIAHRAVAAGDVAALMRVTYPLLAGIEPDAPFKTYMAYMNCLAFAGVPQVRDKSQAEAAQDLEAMQRGCDCVFPATVAPRGMFLIGRTSADGRTGAFTGFYYGVVDGAWAILGNPYDQKKAAEMRRALRAK